MIDYEKIAQERNMQNGFINRIGFKVTAIGKLYAKGEIDLGEMHANPIGSIHGGVIFSMADTVGGVAATTAGSYCTTVNGNINYLNAAMNCKKLIGEAKPVKIGKTLAVIEVMIRNENGKDIACATMTYYYLRDKIPFPFGTPDEN